MQRRPRLILSGRALASNYQRLSDLSTGSECGASIKSDAYGLGIDFVAPILWESDCRTFFVAYLHEGVALRAILPEAIIYVFHGISDSELEYFKEYSLRPVVNTMDDLQICMSQHLQPAVHLDTGMHRLGLGEASWDLLEEFFPDLNASLLMSHLVCADDPEHPLNTIQLERFSSLVSRFSKSVEKCSLANTAGVLMSKSYHFDLVRPGIGLYGGSPDPLKMQGFEPVASWQAPVLQVQTIASGESIGYGASYVADDEVTLLTVAAGYADGYIRSLGNRAQVSLDGFLLPVVGRVSMDLVTIDATLLAQALRRPVVGDWVELMGHSVTVDDLAIASNTISYELLTGLGARLERVIT
ncbi:alanine racemase [Litorivicinus sp.]|nr:alanine racemase [Litorivicinus sp.]MDC1239903.1 alanine racemase [Litorivicinus sp.]